MSKTFITDLRTRITAFRTYVTRFQYVNRGLKKFVTDFRYRVLEKPIYKTDFRYTNVDFDSVQPKSLDNIVVKLDGTEITDIDLSSVRISFNLNSTPSSATFILARYHDKLDYTIANVYSQITNENKITIFDGTILLFTGYINKIQPNSDEETVTIIAEDIRYKMSARSMYISYGGKYHTKNDTERVSTYSNLPSDNVDGDAYIVEEDQRLYVWNGSSWTDYGRIDVLNWANQRVEISTKTALESVFSEISDLITGYETIFFGFVPEYNKEYNDCLTLIDTLIRNSANVNWYVDENEYIRFQTIESGTLKNLPLSGLSSQRTLYDVVMNSITLNKETSNYVASYEIVYGKHLKKTWQRSTAHPNLDNLPEDYVRELTWFAFQQSDQNVLYGSNFIYCGENLRSIASYSNSSFYVNGYFIYQWLAKDEELTFNRQTIGSGLPKKTIYYNSYGKQESNLRWEERDLGEAYKQTFSGPGVIVTSTVYLFYIREPQIDNRVFALDEAYFDLSQNNKKLTEATVTIILDAYEYYGINFKSLINITNTLIANIYKNTNGFPLNISGISIDCSNRIVTLSLTNYGKSYRQRTGNILQNYLSLTEIKSYIKLPQLSFSSGV